MSHVSPNPDKQYTPNSRAEILTYGGEYFQFEDASNTRGMDLHTLAHSLALTNRFGGHTYKPYSVAEHSVRVSRECAPEHALWGLMHDASETYMADVCRPLKALLPDYRRVEEAVTEKIARFYELPLPIPEDVHRADMVLCATEARDLMGVDPRDWNLPQEPQWERIRPLDWQHAKAAFVNRYLELTGQ